jgi:hypothetical protein
MAWPFLSSPTPNHRAEHTHSGSNQRPTFEVADILRAHLPDSLHEHSLLSAARAQGTQWHPKLPHRGTGRAHRLLHRLRHPSQQLQLLSRPPLPEMSRAGESALDRSAQRRTAAGCLFSYCLHVTACDQRLGGLERQTDLRPAVRQLDGHPTRLCRAPLARNARHHRRAAHLGPDDGAPHPSALHRARRSLNVRWRTVQALSASRLAIPGQSAVQGLPRKLPRTPGARACRGRAEEPARGALRRVAQGTAGIRLGGVRQTPIRRTATAHRLPWALHPPHCHQQPPHP